MNDLKKIVVCDWCKQQTTIGFSFKLGNFRVCDNCNNNLVMCSSCGNVGEHDYHWYDNRTHNYVCADCFERYTFVKKIKLQKGIISGIKDCRNYYRVYYNKDTNYCWYQEFESSNSWVEFENPNIVEIYHNNGCKSIFKTAPLTKKDVKRMAADADKNRL